MPLPYVRIDGEPFIADLMYARSDNMTGRAVYQELHWGNLAVVHQDVWQLLKRAAPLLKKMHLKLKICDAYRLPAAHDMMKKLIPMNGFFAEEAEKSQHCLGTAVDVCLCNENGEELLYPTKVDAYDARLRKKVLAGDAEEFMAHLAKARHSFYEEGYEEKIKNREFLRDFMVNAGFEPLEHEWWHYNLPGGKGAKYPLVQLNPADFSE